MLMTKPNRPNLGQRLQEIREERGLSLTQVSEMTGIARSTLYKVENSGVSLTYGKLLDLADGLDLDVTELFYTAQRSAKTEKFTARRAVSHFDAGDIVETENYKYVYLCSELRRKRMVPTTIYLKSKTLEEFGPLIEHPGEEFTIVLSGTVKIVTEFYEPTTLKKGDVLYMDSNMPHAYLQEGKEEAVVLTLCYVDQKDDNEAETTNESDNLILRNTIKRKKK